MGLGVGFPTRFGCGKSHPTPQILGAEIGERLFWLQSAASGGGGGTDWGFVAQPTQIPPRRLQDFLLNKGGMSLCIPKVLGLWSSENSTLAVPAGLLGTKRWSILFFKKGKKLWWNKVHFTHIWMQSRRLANIIHLYGYCNSWPVWISKNFRTSPSPKIMGCQGKILCNDLGLEAECCLGFEVSGEGKVQKGWFWWVACFCVI